MYIPVPCERLIEPYIKKTLIDINLRVTLKKCKHVYNRSDSADRRERKEKEVNQHRYY